MSKPTVIFLSLLAFTGCHRQGAENQPPVVDEVVERSPDNLYVPEITVDDPVYKARLLRGFYEGTRAWKWTAQTFAVALDPPEGPQGKVLALTFVVPA